MKNLGDGLLIWFDDPQQAVHSSLALQSRFEEESFEENLAPGSASASTSAGWPAAAKT